MRTVARAALLGALLLGGGASAVPPAPSPAPDVVRVFSLRHRKAEDAFLLVRPLLTERGSIALQPARNALTVRDAGPSVERAAQAVEAFDVPPRGFFVTVSLLQATSGPVPGMPSGPSSEQARGAGARLKKLFSFTDYSVLDEVVIQGIEGVPVSWNLGSSYRLDFLIESSRTGDVVRLRDLVLARVRRDEKGHEAVRDVARTSINLRLREPFVLGVGREEGGRSALFLVLSASPPEPRPGIGGIR